MNYEQKILNEMIDRYEKRSPTPKQFKVISFDVSKKYPEYCDALSEVQCAIEEALEHLQSWGFVECKKNFQGYYTKITLVENSIPQIYTYLHRTPKADTISKQRTLLESTAACTNGIAKRFCMAMLNCINSGKAIGYRRLSKDVKLLEDILLVLEKLECLNTETYIRNFSEMVFHDSKRLQKIIDPLMRVLADFGDGSGRKDTVLEQYNLIKNPGYVYIKGNWIIKCKEQSICVDAFEGGIAVSSNALGGIERIEVPDGKVISVENLTTYHDTKQSQGAILYLGGFLNTVRANFLKCLYKCEPYAQYFHKGDLDPYGFQILENLKRKTQIPFLPLEMDLETLKRCHHAGHYRPLEEADRKVIHSPDLLAYQAVLQYMEDNNCKIEQECFEAMRLEQATFTTFP